jgi:hypothetical protein
MRFRKRITAMACAGACAMAVALPASAGAAARPQTAGSYVSTYIADAYQDTFCLTYEGGGDPKDGDFVYMAPCRSTPTQVWLVYRNNDNVGFVTPLAEPAPLALGQRGRSSATIVIDYNKGTNYVIQLLGRGGDGHLWVLSNEFYAHRWLGVPKGIRGGHTALTHWVSTTRGVNVLLKFSSRQWKADSTAAVTPAMLRLAARQ